jgi:hypothetical protein
MRIPGIPATTGLVVAAIAATLVVTLSAQSPSYRAPRTPDGQPDLQGFWTNSTYVPLERPKGVTKEFYTPAEAQDAIKRAAARESEQTEAGTVADVHYDFSQFGLDRSQGTVARNLRTSIVVDPPDGRIPEMTEEGRRREAAREEAAKNVGRWDSAESNQLDDRCLIMAGAGPPMLDAAYNSNYHIVQAPGYVMILVEMIHDVRVIPLDPAPGAGSPRVQSRGDGGDIVSPNVRQWMGVSRGRWEGETLVVETTNFNGKNPLRGSTANLRVTERFTRVASDQIMYRFTIEDRSTWPRPWTGEMPMQQTKGPLFEHACHEGNFGLYNTLVGARLAEKKAAEEGGAAK